MAVCRRIGPLLVDERSRRALEVALLYADGLADEAAVTSAGESAYRASESPAVRADDARKYAAWAVSAAAQAPITAFEVADEATFHAADAVAASGGNRRDELAAHADLLRCLFRNPLQARAPWSPFGLTDAACSLAQAIYQRCSFKRLPELAQALQAAGRGTRSCSITSARPGPMSAAAGPSTFS